MNSYKKADLETPICIVGAGPGGSTTSLVLSQQGIPHVLLDKQAFPRHKVCGESFDGRVTHILNALSPSYLAELEASGALLKSWSYSLHTEQLDIPIRFPHENTPRLLIDRYQFDQFLLEKARSFDSCTFIEKQEIQQVKSGSGIEWLQGPGLSIQCQLAIFATGNTSRFSNQQQKPANPFLFSRAYYEGLPGEATEVEIYYFQQPVRGCLILCPLSGGRHNVEIGLEKRLYQKSGRTMSALLTAYIEQRSDLQERFRKARQIHPLRGTYMALLGQRLHLAEGGRLFVGSNAYSVNPVTGLGVGNAMSMGQTAGQLIAEHWEQVDFTRRVQAAYPKKVKKRLREVLFFNYLLNQAQRQIAWIEPLLTPVLRSRFVGRLLQRSEWVREVRNPRFYWDVLKEKS